MQRRWNNGLIQLLRLKGQQNQFQDYAISKEFNIDRSEIVVEYKDIKFNEHNEKMQDYRARVFQHEIDHLNGICIDVRQLIGQFMDRIEMILDRAMEIAGERNHEYVTLEHLLFSILQEDPIQKIITKCKIDFEPIINELLVHIDTKLTWLEKVKQEKHKHQKECLTEQ